MSARSVPADLGRVRHGASVQVALPLVRAEVGDHDVVLVSRLPFVAAALEGVA